MVSDLHQPESLSLSLPITRYQQQVAHTFAQEQPTPTKTNQVYRNTLAVAIVRDYLDMLGFTTAVHLSDSWNPVLRLMADVADLEITGVGRLECRPLAPDQTTCPVPPEAWTDRVGYVLVALDLAAEQAHLLGFSSSLVQGQLAVDHLQSLEMLIDHLHGLMTAPVPDRVGATVSVAGTHLGRWFTGLVDAGWQSLDLLLGPGSLQPAISFRGAALASRPDQTEGGEQIRRARELDLNLGDQPVALVVELQQQTPSTYDITLQVHPICTPCLPALLSLTVLETDGSEFMQAESRQADNYIQLCFSGQAGETFQVRVTAGDTEVVESFVI